MATTETAQTSEAIVVDDGLPLWKRLVDLGVCALALPVVGLATVLVAILLKLTSPGPIFFRQERVGYRGRRFGIFKFRTMHTGAETRSHETHFADLVKSNRPMQKLDGGDARVIRGGWLLRASGFDELPQFINVLRGEMSVVGPRPCIVYEYENYTEEQRHRFDSVPGLTGLWQVSGKNRTTFEEMVRLDVEYGRRKSLWLDLKILCLTPAALAGQILDSRRRRRDVPAPVPAPGRHDALSHSPSSVAQN